MREKYKVTVLNNTSSTFILELTEEELEGAKKLASELSGIDFCDSMDISFEKV